MTASSLEEKEAKVMPLTAAKVSQLQAQRKWKLYYHNPREKAFAQYRREQHRQVLKRGKINRFPTTRALDLPLGYPSALPHFQHSAMAGNQYGKQLLSGLDWDKQTDRQQQGDGWEEECNQAEIYGKYQRPTKKKRDKELQVWSNTPGTSDTTPSRAFPAGDNNWSLVIQPWASAPESSIGPCCHLSFAVWIDAWMP